MRVTVDVSSSLMAISDGCCTFSPLTCNYRSFKEGWMVF